MNKKRILFVDDEPALVRLSRRMIERLGYSVESFDDPLEALRAIREQPARFDALFADQTMPDMTGLALAREAMAIRPGLPVVLCTGYSDVDDEAVRNAGVRRLLIKPVDQAALAEALADILPLSRGR